jgi:hypothetical protein
MEEVQKCTRRNFFIMCQDGNFLQLVQTRYNDRRKDSFVLARQIHMLGAALPSNITKIQEK